MLWLLLATVVVVSSVHAAYSPQYTSYTPYSDYDDYYFLPKPAIRYPYYPMPSYEEYRPYPYYKPVPEQDPLRLEERAAREAALPVGQETWYESDPPAPRWRPAGIDDVNAAFLQNLIISQMARNAENRVRTYTPRQNVEEDSYGVVDRDLEDEDVRELKALAGKPFSHSPKTEVHEPAPTNNYEYYDYPSEDSFINWGSKRGANAAPVSSTSAPTAPPGTASPAQQGQREVVQLRPATPVRHPFPEPVMKMLQREWNQQKRSPNVYEDIKHMLAADQKPSSERSRLQKRFVASEQDLVKELRGLKRRIST